MIFCICTSTPVKFATSDTDVYFTDVKRKIICFYFKPRCKGPFDREAPKGHSKRNIQRHKLYLKNLKIQDIGGHLGKFVLPMVHKYFVVLCFLSNMRSMNSFLASISAFEMCFDYKNNSQSDNVYENIM